MASHDGKPTLLSLARQLGVSRQTVSNVLNAPDVVHPTTRQRVLDAIDESGYRPSAAGRALRTRRSMNVAYRLYPAVDGINGAVMDRFLHNLVIQARHHGYRVTLFDSPDYSDEVEALVEQHRAGLIDACVLTDTHTHDQRPGRLRTAGVPTVVFGRPWGDLDAPHAWLDIDGSAGCAAAVRHLRGGGHRRIGFLGWPEGSGVGDDRCAGWLRAMADLNVSGLRASSEDGVQTGASAAGQLLDAGATAVVCTSDSLALGAASRWRAAGLRTDAVIGFDDTPVAAALGISSVAQPVERAAAALVDLMLAELRGDPHAERRQLLPAELVIRPTADHPHQSVHPIVQRPQGGTP